jgi:uncharacterized membrane protein YjjP (DUF1212 family)
MGEINWIELLIAVILSAMGGVVRKLSELENDPNMKITLRQYVFSSIISCFVGIIMYLILKHYNWSMLLIMAAASVSGFIGSPIMYSVSAIFMKRLHKEAGVSE